MGAARRLMLMRRDGFDPRLIAGLALWIDASDGATVWQDAARSTLASANGDPVGGITDRSGVGAHASAAVASARPSLIVAARNGRSVVRFDGVDDVMELAGTVLGGNAAYSVICVCAVTGGSGVRSPLEFGVGHPALKESSLAWVVRELGVWREINADTVSLGNWRVRGLITAADGAQAYRQVDEARGSLVATMEAATGGGTLARAAGNGAACDLGEVLAWNRALTLEEYRSVTRYLTAKWGAT